MSGDHAKREIVTDDKPAGLGKTLSRESGNKYKEESSSYIKSHQRDEDKKGKTKENKRYYKKKGGEAHMGCEWDSDESSTDSSSDKDTANIVINKGLLFPNIGHKCLMAKDGKKKKVYSRATPKYTTSDDEGSSSDNEDDLISLFANLNMYQKKKLNELIETINEKDDLLECQEDLLVKENKKFVKLKNAYALEVKKCENLTKELSMCNNSISSLRIENDNLNAKIEELSVYKASTSTFENVVSCTTCRDINVEAIDDHLAMIKQQNDHIATLNTKIAEHELENEKIKFAKSMLYNGRRPDIKDGYCFQQGNQNKTKLNAPKKLSNFVKAKAPMVQDREGYILYPANYPKHKIIMHLCIKMRLLVLGIPLMLKCLRRKFLMHQMNIMFHLRLLMLLMCLLTN
jgi:hypothetical protein